MANNSKSKLKLLYLKRILEEETDESRRLSMTQLVDRLHAYEIPAERKGVYRGLETFKEFGFDIRTYQRNPVQYGVVRRGFTLFELMLLVDAVESCKFLARRQSNALTMNLKLFASDHERALLDRRVHVPGRIMLKKDSVFECIDILHDAMRQHKKAFFMYHKFNLNGEHKATHDGKPHEVAPVGITYWDGCYYLTAWNDDHECMTEFRIDRMEKLWEPQNAATRNEEITHHIFDGDGHESFDRFGGEPFMATLLVDGDKVEIIMDRFGDAAEMYEHDDETAKAIVKIRKSEPFFDWVAGLGGAVRIHESKSLKEEYVAYLDNLARKEDADGQRRNA